MGRSRTLLRGRSGRVVAALAVVASLLVVAVSGYALLAHRGLLAESGTTVKTATEDLSAGLGPTLCLAAGAVSALLVVVAWPWRTHPNVLVLRDGTVQPQPRH